MPDAAPVLAALSSCIQCKAHRDELASVAVAEVAKALPQAGWVGVYWLHGDMLELGPYLGPPTEHTRIAVGTGVCGTAVAEDRDQLVPDVLVRTNYLACSARTRSEIVVLIRSNGKVVGQLDLDSDQVDAFSKDDHGFLRMVAGAMGNLLPLMPDGVPEGDGAPPPVPPPIQGT